jgi:hypothetical protein
MKKILAIAFAACSLNIAHAQNEMIVDPNAEVRTINGTFNSIKVSGGIDIYLSQSDKEAVAVSASEDKFVKRIITTVENGTLRIKYDEEGLFHVGKNRKLKAYISFKDINKLDASGACDIRVAGSITTDNFHLVCSGASGFKGDVKVNDLEIDLSGASDIKLAGSARTVNIESSGASDVKAFGLVTEVCTARASGASDINITVNKELNAHVSGASSINYAGEGMIKDYHSSGASSIKKKA